MSDKLTELQKEFDKLKRRNKILEKRNKKLREENAALSAEIDEIDAKNIPVYDTSRPDVCEVCGGELTKHLLYTTSSGTKYKFYCIHYPECWYTKMEIL